MVRVNSSPTERRVAPQGKPPAPSGRRLYFFLEVLRLRKEEGKMQLQNWPGRAEEINI
jgi:hypothetical protein